MLTSKRNISGLKPALALCLALLASTAFGESPMTNNKELATLGGGCFWCLEAVFEYLEGVDQVYSGYAGGDEDNPSYREVCGGDTGHAEVIQLRYDPAVTSYREILTVFFTIHDPTTLNRQGADVGTQYRSVIFFHSDAQETEAREAIRVLEKEKVYDNPVVTQVVPAETFYKAEANHQNYYARNSSQGYCQAVINPKLRKFREKFSDKMKP